MGHLIFFLLQIGTQKSKFDNCNKKGSFGLHMMREFQIWSQNLNQTTFDPFWLKDSQKLAKSSF